MCLTDLLLDVRMAVTTLDQRLFRFSSLIEKNLQTISHCHTWLLTRGKLTLKLLITLPHPVTLCLKASQT